MTKLDSVSAKFIGLSASSNNKRIEKSDYRFPLTAASNTSQRRVDVRVLKDRYGLDSTNSSQKIMQATSVGAIPSQHDINHAALTDVEITAIEFYQSLGYQRLNRAGVSHPFDGHLRSAITKLNENKLLKTFRGTVKFNLPYVKVGSSKAITERFLSTTLLSSVAKNFMRYRTEGSFACVFGKSGANLYMQENPRTGKPFSGGEAEVLYNKNSDFKLLLQVDYGRLAAYPKIVSERQAFNQAQQQRIEIALKALNNPFLNNCIPLLMSKLKEKEETISVIDLMIIAENAAEKDHIDSSYYAMKSALDKYPFLKNDKYEVLEELGSEQTKPSIVNALDLASSKSR